MKTYLITGGAGFIGSHLVQELLKEHQVIVVDNFDDFYSYEIKLKNLCEATGITFKTSGDKNIDIQDFTNIERDRFKLYAIDICDQEALFQVFNTHTIAAVIHLAALAGVRPSIEQPVRYEKVNIQGTMNIFEAVKTHQIKKLIFASSSSVYGNNKKTPFAETDAVDFAISPYAATKKAGEVLGHVYHHLYGIDMFLLRFFTVYGPRQRPDLAIHKFTKLIDNGKEIPFFGDGSTARDYTYIQDIIQGVLKSIAYVEGHEKVYEILNLGESEVVTLNQMVETIEKALGKKAKLNQLPMQPGDVNLTNASIEKANKLIGYSPTTNFEDGINKFVAWYKKNTKE